MNIANVKILQQWENVEDEILGEPVTRLLVIMDNDIEHRVNITKWNNEKIFKNMTTGISSMTLLDVVKEIIPEYEEIREEDRNLSYMYDGEYSDD
jgi:hypothetical protein